ncbi:uncharacterized protein LOC142323443 isoform X2 [Lycorma delicatula]|uniref:uncharacterized protein LOC142323443 isoform X2 n=1 Tax=Lycorma delicatula TaxID=130591 RepID=UPI003F51335F
MEKVSVKSEGGSRSTENKESRHDSVKRSSERRPTDSNTRKFAILSSECVSKIADSIGISDLPDDVLSGLAEDTSYKLREVIHNCSILLKNTKRRKLLTEDVFRVFDNFNVPPVYGHLTGNETDFVHIPSAEVFVLNDFESDIIAMATSDLEFTQCTWVVVEPDQQSESKDNKQKDSNINVKPGTSSENVSTANKSSPKPGGKPDDPPGTTRPPHHLLNYYLQVSKVIVGGSTSLLEVALNDLRTNPNVAPVCPYFLNLVALSVNKLQRHKWLTDALLSTVKALVENPFIDPSCYLAANRAANSLLVIAIEPKIANNCDDLLLRARAAELLSKVLHTWTIEMKQQMDIVRQLLQLLLDKNISLQSQYGAIVCLISLGYRILFMYFWPVMERYFPLLEEKYKTCSSADIAHVKGAIMMAAELMYRKEWSSCSTEESKRRLRIDYMLNDYFGDSLIPRRQQYFKQRTIDVKLDCDIDEVSSTKNYNVMVDYDFDYQNWNPSYMLQRNPFMQNSNPSVTKTVKKHHNVYDVFEISERIDEQKSIIFNFDGSNQVDSRKLKRRELDSKQVSYQNEVHRLSGMWYKQNMYKSTRTIKFCIKLHTKCSTGDLLTIM